MIRRQPLSEAPDQVKQLFEELRSHGDYLVYEDEEHRPVLSIAPLEGAARTRRLAAARRLGALLDSFPPNLYSEEETNALIGEAIAATKGQYPGDTSAQRAGDGRSP